LLPYHHTKSQLHHDFKLLIHFLPFIKHNGSGIHVLHKIAKTSAKDNLGYHRLKFNKPWFDGECSKLIDQRIQAKLKWLQNPSQINGDNLQILRRETIRTFRNKKREYLKDKINELETNNKNKNIRDLYRGINEFKKGYQPRIHIIMERMVIC
jgi:hypothetical protein